MVIAWVSGRWVSRKERAELIDSYRELIDAMIAQPSLTADEMTDLDRYMTEIERLERIHRAEVDLLYFAYEYFGELYNPDNSGNWIPVGIDKAPQFHHEICEIMNAVSTKEVNAKIAVAAPRSHAKSSYLSKAFPIHEIVFRKRKYVIIISETPQVSTGNMEWLSLQLKSNEKLRKDFGPLLSPKQQENPKDNSSEFIAWEPRPDGTQRLLSRVEAASTGQALRGRNWNGARPDLIICDDLEGKKNTNTELLRSEMKDWFTQVVVPLGDPEGKRTAFVYMGTMVHHDSLLRYVMENRSDFKTKLFRAIIEWPERMDLWEACRLVYIDRDNPNRAADAEALYRMNQAEMDRGAVVLWPEVQPLWKLMTWKWDNGSKAFNTEYMNNPIDEESMVFNPDKFTYYDGSGPRDFSSKDYDVYMGVDFAMGKTRGDYSAIVTVAKHRESGAIFVIDAYGDRIHPDQFLKVIVEKVIRYQPAAIAAEAQAAQEFFVHKLKEALRASGYPTHNRVREVHQRARKELRIEAMLPDIENGTIRFSRKHALLLEQFEQYGTNAHDDLPDALAMALDAAKNGRKKIMDKPAWL
jgi:predicted phage terminase large subunit-like protein